MGSYLYPAAIYLSNLALVATIRRFTRADADWYFCSESFPDSTASRWWSEASSYWSSAFSAFNLGSVVLFSPICQQRAFRVGTVRDVRGDSGSSLLGQASKNYTQRFSVVDFDDVELPYRQFDLRGVAGVLSR